MSKLDFNSQGGQAAGKVVPITPPTATASTGSGCNTPGNSRKKGVMQPTPPPRKPFPVQLLPPACRRLVEQGAKARGVDPAHMGVLTLPALAGAIGNSRILRVKRSYVEPAIIWAALVSPSGTMKSAQLDDVLGPHRVRDRELVDMVKSDLADYERDLARYKSGVSTVRPNRPPCRAVLVNDVTVEALALRLSDNPRGLLLGRDELSGWIGSFDAYKRSNGADVGSYLEMHRGGVLKVDRKRPDQPTIHVPRAALSVAGTIQPRVLARAIGQDGRDNGLLARLLVAMPPPAFAKWTEDDVDTATYSGYEQVVGSLLALEGKPGTECDPIELELSADARNLWRPYHDRMMAEASTAGADLAAAYSKLRGGALRFALVLALARDAEQGSAKALSEVDVAAMQAGIRLAEWFANEAERVYAVFAETDDERESRRIIEWIEERGGSTTVRDLVTYGPRPRFSETDEAEKYLQRLAGLGMGSMGYPGPDAKGGRPPGATFTITAPIPGCITPEILENLEVLQPQPVVREYADGAVDEELLSRWTPAGDGVQT